MSGKEFKNVLLHTGMTLTDIAGKLSMSTQALNSIFNGSDVRSGIIEKCVDRLGILLTILLALTSVLLSVAMCIPLTPMPSLTSSI